MEGDDGNGDLNLNEIVVVGSCMVDFVTYAPYLPKSGETVHGNEFATNFGGKGANQCVAAAKLGCTTTLIARVGDDSWGDKYLNNLMKNGVDTSYVIKTARKTTGIAQICVAKSGDNHIVVVPGANDKLSVEDIEDASERIKTAKLLILQLETLPEVAIAAMKLCQGVTILNGAPYIPDYDLELLKLPTIFCVNEIEASQFADVPITNTLDAEKAASKLMSLGCKSVIITLGENGAICADKSGVFRITAPKGVEVVDSTGAGDAFIGALAYLLVRRKEMPMREMIEKACCIASDSVTRKGTQPSFPDEEILDKLGI